MQNLANINFNQFEIHILCNACSDNSFVVATTEAEKYRFYENVKIVVSTLTEKGKIAALNHCLENTGSRIVLNVDDDCIVESSAIGNLLDTLEQDDVVLCGSMAAPSHKKNELLISKYMTYRSILSFHRDNKLIGGRFFGFKKEYINSFPKGVASEDYWASLYSIMHYGRETVKVCKSARVHYYPPTTWPDLIKQITRFRHSVTQLLTIFPEFKPYFRSEIKIADENIIKSRAQIDESLRVIGVDYGFMENFHIMLEEIIKDEEGITFDDILDKDGTWEYIPSTKLKKRI